MRRFYVAICAFIVTMALDTDRASLVVSTSHVTSTIRSVVPLATYLNVSDTPAAARPDRTFHPSRPAFSTANNNGTRLPVLKLTSCVNCFTWQVPARQRQTGADSGAGQDTDRRRRCPQVIIIGAKKAGTRALLEFLRLHPDVRAVGPEVHFFDKNFHKGFEWYRRQMPVTLDAQLTVEKTPSYLITRSVPSRVRQMSTSVRLIVVLRDPVTRALSDFTQTSVKRRRETPTFEQLAFVDVDDGDGNVTTTVNTSWRAMQIGLYAVHVRRWLSQFSADQLHFVSGERLVDDPARVLFDVQNFLGLSHVITDEHFRFSREKGFPCIVRDPRRAPDEVHCLGKTKGRRHPIVQPAALKRLREFFRPHNEDLYQLTHINFGWQ